MLDAGQVLVLDVRRSQGSLGGSGTSVSCSEQRRCVHAPHLAAAAPRGVQVQVTSDDVELDPQQDHQHAGAVHGHDGARETWSGSAAGEVSGRLPRAPPTWILTDDLQILPDLHLIGWSGTQGDRCELTCRQERGPP